METENIKCQSCGGTLRFEPNKQMLVCDYCNNEFKIEDIQNKDKENEEYCHNLNECRCQSCGASMVIDANIASSTCVYCHSPITITSKLEGEIKPDKIIPFNYDIEQTKKIFLENVKKRKFIPKSYFNKEQLNNIQGIYYPFWIVDIDLSANATFSATKVSTWSNGSYRYTKTSYYNLDRSGDIHLEDVSSCAIKNVNKKMLEGIFPYPKDKHLDFNKSYLVGYKSHKRDLSKEDIHDDIYAKIKEYSIEQLQSNISFYNTINVKSYNHNIHKDSWSYVFVPIYLLTYTKKDKTYTYAMNGYTGKVYGEYPISIIKLLLTCLAILLAGVILGLVVYL